MLTQFTDRELATVLAALRYWQQDLSENDGPISEHFADHTPLSVEEIDDLCERLNCAAGLLEVAESMERILVDQCGFSPDSPIIKDARHHIAKARSNT